MRSMRTLGLVAMLLGAATAHAQEPAGQPLVDFLGVADLTADGVTAARLHVVVLDAQGKVSENLKAKLTVSQGTVGELVPVGNGIYAIDYVPPRVSEPSQATLTLRLKAADGERLERTTEVRLMPALPREIVLEAPLDLVAGRDRSAPISIAVGTTRTDVDDLLVRTSEGELTGLEAQADGRFVGTLQPKAVNYPHLVMVAAADLRQPDLWGFAAVPMTGQVDYPVVAPDGAEVTMDVAGKAFGPIVARGGTARVPILVPPGVQKATVTILAGGTLTTDAIDLRIPETRRLMLLPLPDKLPAEGPMPLRVVVRAPDGTADTGAQVEFVVDSGTVGPAVHVGGGVYEGVYTPPQGGTGKVTVIAQIVGLDKQVDHTSFELVPGLGRGLALEADPPALDTDATALALYTAAKGGLPVVITGGGATQQGEPEAMEDGRQKWTFQANPTGPVEVFAVQQGVPTGLDATFLVLSPGRTRLPNDGGAAVPVLVTAADAWGHPVPGVEVALSVVDGDGKVAPTVTTGEDGTALTLYTVGTQVAVADLVATAGDLRGVTSIAQLPASYPPLQVPVSGSPRHTEVTARWQSNVAWARIEHGVAPVDPGWGAVAATDPVAEPEPAPEPTPEPADEVEEPWVRARAAYAFSSYRYQQTPAGTGGTLLDNTFTIGGDSGKNAHPQGWEVDGRAWLPMFRYLGLAASYRATYYGVTAAIFGDQVANDTLHNLKIDALGRFFLDGKGNRYHLGARAGFHLNDLIYFTQDRTATSVIYRYDTLAVPSLSLGGELGVDIRKFYGVVGAYRELAYASGGYAVGVDVLLGYGLADHVTLDLGGEWLDREIEVVGEESGNTHGTLDDTQWLVRAGLGVAF